MADPTTPVPRASGPNPLVEAALPRPGQATLARVLAQTDASLIRLMTPNGTLTLPQTGPAPALAAGTVVRVSVALDGAGQPRVQVTPIAAEGPPNAGRPAPPPAPATAQMTAQLTAQVTTPAATAITAAPASSGAGAVRITLSEAPPPPAAAPPETPLARDLLQALLPRSAAQQSALPRALAPILAAAEAPQGTVPEPVRAAAQRVEAVVLALDAPPSAAAIADAVTRSGVLREAILTRTDRPPADLKSALLDLVRAIGAVAPRPAAEDLPRERPPIPRRGQAPGPSAPERIGAAPAAEIAPAALREAAEGALDRVRLLQLASSGEGPEAPPAAGPTAPSLSAEVPVRLGEQVGVLAFAIDAEDQGREPGDGGERRHRVWRLTFAIDLEPLGPVHGQVRLQDGDAAITLWAERAETARAFLDAAPELRHDLAAADLAVVDVAVKRGQPPHRVEPRAGRSLDVQA